MKKSKIVSYTSEELEQLPDESDWAAADAMTDEEIEAAIASDPEEAEMHAGWMQRARVVRPQARFVMCVVNKGNEAGLTLLRVYKVIPAQNADERGWLRVMDDTGVDHLYPANQFVPVQLSEAAEHSFDVAVALR